MRHFNYKPWLSRYIFVTIVMVMAKLLQLTKFDWLYVLIPVWLLCLLFLLPALVMLFVAWIHLFFQLLKKE